MSKKTHNKPQDWFADGCASKNPPQPAKKRKWAVATLVIGLAALGAMAFLNFGGLMGQQATQVVPDFSVDTANGRYVLSENRGKTLVYFFSFPG